MAIAALVGRASAGSWDVLVDFAAHRIRFATCTICAWADPPVLVGQVPEGWVYVLVAERAGVFLRFYPLGELTATVAVVVSARCGHGYPRTSPRDNAHPRKARQVCSHTTTAAIPSAAPARYFTSVPGVRV